MSKYERLLLYLKDNNLDEYKMSFEEINNILGFSIDHSFLKYKKECLNYGYQVIKISLKEKFVLFRKVSYE